ncbi:MAG TPA: phosphoglycerate dehydrogenase [Pirellulales bacterium]|jgi:phosphoglycerate dehydrogenase-like enzyme|nr:phosphoglycerate dehydrogenase [Pirellulales bacterium]
MAPRVLVCPIEMTQKPTARWSEILTEAGLETVCRPQDLWLRDPVKLLAYLKAERIDAIVAGLETVDRHVLESGLLRAVARYGVGYDSVDIAAATECKVAVTITPGVNHIAVAEHTLAMILGLMRLVRERDRATREGNWVRFPNARLAGKTLGLVGLGRIGKAIVPRAQGFGVKVIAYDPYPDREFAAAHDVRICSLDEIWADSDIVSLHLPAGPGSKPLMDRSTLAKLRPGAILINTARGVLVDDDALIEALVSGHLGGAALDCFVVEPLPTTSRLLAAPNLLLSPHVAGQDHESAAAAGSLATECLACLYRGQELQPGCLVNPAIFPGWKW